MLLSLYSVFQGFLVDLYKTSYCYIYQLAFCVRVNDLCCDYVSALVIWLCLLFNLRFTIVWLIFQVNDSFRQALCEHEYNNPYVFTAPKNLCDVSECAQPAILYYCLIVQLHLFVPWICSVVFIYSKSFSRASLLRLSFSVRLIFPLDCAFPALVYLFSFNHQSQLPFTVSSFAKYIYATVWMSY